MCVPCIFISRRCSSCVAAHRCPAARGFRASGGAAVGGFPTANSRGRGAGGLPRAVGSVAGASFRRTEWGLLPEPSGQSTLDAAALRAAASWGRIAAAGCPPLALHAGLCRAEWFPPLSRLSLSVCHACHTCPYSGYRGWFGLGGVWLAWVLCRGFCLAADASGVVSVWFLFFVSVD